jgi:DNA-binding MarR family transcriptional regulator
MKRRLIREAISEEQQEQYLDMFANIPADERKRIREAIKECLNIH